MDMLLLHRKCFILLVFLILMMFLYFSSRRFEIYSTFKGQKCKKITFLKVPKTGSTTLACVLLRFGVNHNLKLFLQKISGVSEKQQRKLMEEKQHFDIFAFHAKYNRNFYTQIVKKPTIIGLIRRPDLRIVSHAFYAHLERKFDDLKGLSPKNFIDKIAHNTFKYGMNNVITDYFGIGDNVSLKQLKQLNQDFRLVLILEKINKSMVLLRRLLNWSHYDILYMVKNRGKNHRVRLNANQIDVLKQTNSADYRIYTFFNNELEKRIHAEGLDFIDEVKHFELILHFTNMFCIRNVSRDRSIDIPASKWDSGFTISYKDCLLLLMKWNDFKHRRFKQL